MKTLTEFCALHSTKYVLLGGKKWKLINPSEADILA